MASASPRRRQILGTTGLPFEVIPSDADESLEPGIEPEAAATLLARRKAAAVAATLGQGPGWVIGSDTIVALGEGAEAQLLPKPVDEADAKRMLEGLSGSRHRVITGVAVIDLSNYSEEGSLDGPRGLFSAFERTWVSMRMITAQEVAAYVDSGEWRDKAGGYAIQENADAFVEKLEEGGFDNVVGLPLALTMQLLEKAGVFLPL